MMCTVFGAIRRMLAQSSRKLEPPRNGRAHREALRPNQIVIDPAMGDGFARREVSLLAPPDEQHMLRMRMDAPYLTQQLGAGSAREPLPRQNQGDVFSGVGEVLEVIPTSEPTQMTR